MLCWQDILYTMRDTALKLGELMREDERIIPDHLEGLRKVLLEFWPLRKSTTLHPMDKHMVGCMGSLMIDEKPL